MPDCVQVAECVFVDATLTPVWGEKREYLPRSKRCSGPKCRRTDPELRPECAEILARRDRRRRSILAAHRRKFCRCRNRKCGSKWNARTARREKCMTLGKPENKC